MAPSPPNPFHFGKAVSGAAFCPRPILEQELRARLRAGQNVLVQGDRRMGKTSLIRQVVRSVARHAELYVDLFGVRSSADVLARVTAGLAAVDPAARWGTLIAQALSFVNVSFRSGNFSLSLSAPGRLALQSFDEVFDFLQRTRGGRWIVVLDEFQDILKLAAEGERTALLAHLRSRIQFLKGTPFVYAGSTRTPMHGIFYHPASPFFKSAVTLDVGPIDRADFSAWICAQFTRGGRRVNRETLDRMCDLAGDVPGDVQQMCAAIWDITTPGTSFGDADLPRALERIWEQEQRSNEAIVDDVTQFQLRCLVALAHSSDLTPTSTAFLSKVGSAAQGASVLKACRRFEKDGVLAKKGTRFVFVNPFFREWLKARMG